MLKSQLVCWRMEVDLPSGWGEVGRGFLVRSRSSKSSEA
jgi:uncharacterized protein YbdZ (MbtH family)